MTDEEFEQYKYQKEIDEGVYIPAFRPSNELPIIKKRSLRKYLDEAYKD